MGIHLNPFYRFKGRVIRTTGLLVEIIRTINDIRDLDSEISADAGRIERDTQQIGAFSKKVQELKGEESTAGKEAKESKIPSEKTPKAANKTVRAIRRNIRKHARQFSRDCNKRMRKILTINLNAQTLANLESKFFGSFKTEMKDSHIKHAVVNCEEVLKEQVHVLEEEFKAIQKSGIVELAVISFRSDASVEDKIRRLAIELFALLKSLETANTQHRDWQIILTNWEQAEKDIIQTASLVAVLVRREKGFYLGLQKSLKKKGAKDAAAVLEGKYRKMKTEMTGAAEQYRRLHNEIRQDINNYEGITEHVKTLQNMIPKKTQSPEKTQLSEAA